MKVFSRYTLKTLLKNRTRTIVTIIGIMLSVALVTAVLEGAYSGVKFLINSEIEKVGSFHGIFRKLDADTAADVLSDDNIKSTLVWNYIGCADIGSQNEYKPYLGIFSSEDLSSDMVSFRMLSGRLPENSSEIAIPAHLAENGGVYYSTGDQMTLLVGRRECKGITLYTNDTYDSEESLEGLRPMTFTVVGIYERLDFSVEPRWAPGYFAVTTGLESDTRDVFFTVKKVSAYYTFMRSQTYSESTVDHSDLIRLYGSLRNNSISRVIYGFAGVLIFLISFGSVSLIYNSFSISVSDRTRQFGILKSIGATKKQIRNCVFFEAFVLSLIGTALGLFLGCAGIGLTLWLLRDSFGAFVNNIDVQMKLVLNPVILLIAAVISITITLISAWIPAKRADKLSAIDAIRQSGDVKINKKAIKTSKLTEKLFGFEGMMASKNFKRNRKRYTATVLSLFVSISLFISASSFCDYLKKTVSDVSRDVQADVLYDYEGDSDDAVSFYKLTENLPEVKESYYSSSTYATLLFDNSLFDKSYVDFMGGISDENFTGMAIYFISNETFDRIAEKNGLDKDMFYDPAQPRAILYNSGVYYDNDRMKWQTYRLLDSKSFPAQAQSLRIKEVEGYEFLMTSDEGETPTILYYPENEYHDYITGKAEIDNDLVIRLPLEECALTEYLDIAADVEEPLMGINKTMPVLMYPYGMKDAVMGRNERYEPGFYGGSGRENNVVLFYKTDDHTALTAKIKELLTDRRLSESGLYDYAESMETDRMAIKVINVFAYGFVILISLIAIANVFNTISTNINLRRRELAMLRSIGMSEKGFDRMMTYESLIYGFKGLAFGLPAAFIMTFLIFKVTSFAVIDRFYVPWYSVAIAVFSVFLVVFVTMIYSWGKIRRENVLDALKNENL